MADSALIFAPHYLAAPFPRLANGNNTEGRKIDPSTRRPLAPPGLPFFVLKAAVDVSSGLTAALAAPGGERHLLAANRNAQRL
jgi:hypothetical protein